MFSSIDEAWDNNPVKEITNKLTNGSFNKDQSNHTNIYKFKQNIPDEKKSAINSDSGINLLTEDMSIGQNFQTNFSSCSPISKFKNKTKSSNSGSGPKNVSSVEFSEFETTVNNMSTTDQITPINIAGTDCSFSARHLNKCSKCSTQLNKLINKKVKEKINDIFLDINLNQIKSGHLNQQPQQPLPQLQLSPQTGLSDSWKETLIIIAGAVIVIFIIFLMTKSLNSGKN
jgi:hypothetical protein